jgi:hypothetical protein
VKLKLSLQVAPAAKGNSLAQSGLTLWVKFPPRVNASEPVRFSLPMFCTEVRRLDTSEYLSRPKSPTCASSVSFFDLGQHAVDVSDRIVVLGRFLDDFELLPDAAQRLTATC